MSWQRWLELPAWFLLVVLIGLNLVRVHQDWFGLATGWFLLLWGGARLVLTVRDRLSRDRGGRSG